ncbi:MAG TPA: EamA family transporter [Chthoniobacterales bacterium]|jgi:undecaprenyl phosphate-alpha-L-ara4N flippase subunit ArnF
MQNKANGFANPWLQLALSVVFVTLSELLLKRGATETAHLAGRWSWTGLSSLASPYVWLGILLVVFSFITWLHVLRYIPLSVAFPISQVVHVLIPLCSWLFLGEFISDLRWCGIALVSLGLAIVAKPVARLEERL